MPSCAFSRLVAALGDAMEAEEAVEAPERLLLALLPRRSFDRGGPWLGPWMGEEEVGREEALWPALLLLVEAVPLVEAPGAGPVEPSPAGFAVAARNNDDTDGANDSSADTVFTMSFTLRYIFSKSDTCGNHRPSVERFWAYSKHTSHKGGQRPAKARIAVNTRAL